MVRKTVLKGNLRILKSHPTGDQSVVKDGSIRDKAFKTLCRWLEGHCTELGHVEYLKLWKALFYCMWMADKPSYQQTLAIRLGDVWLNLHRVAPEAGLAYARAFWETISREWTGIDRLRLDKYYNLLRRFLLAGYETMRESDWKVEHIQACNQILAEWPLSPRRREIPSSFRLYALENFAALFKHVTAERLDDPAAAQQILSPYLELIAQSDKKPVLNMAKGFFEALPTESFDPKLVSKLCLSRGERESVCKANRQLLYSASQDFTSRQ